MSDRERHLARFPQNFPCIFLQSIVRLNNIFVLILKKTGIINPDVKWSL
jgi:hypothetical protein